MKDILIKKRRFLEEETINLEVGCSAIIQKSFPSKSKDPCSFTIPFTVGTLYMGKALLYWRDNVNLVPLSMMKIIRR